MLTPLDRAPSYIAEGTALGDGTRVMDGAHIHSDVIIGKNCTIGDSVTIESHTKIGNNVSIQCKAYITAHSFIEDDCFIGPGVLTSNDPMMAMGRLEDRLPYRKGIFMCQGARLGVGVIVNPGIVIGRGSMVASGSVVTKDIPDGQLWMGIPAKRWCDVDSWWKKIMYRYKILQVMK